MRRARGLDDDPLLGGIERPVEAGQCSLHEPRFVVLARAPSNGPDAFFVAQFSAGYATNMFGFDLRQGHHGAAASGPAPRTLPCPSIHQGAARVFFAMRLKQVLVEQQAWSQYLEVGIGPDAEVFAKAPCYPPSARLSSHSSIEI